MITADYDRHADVLYVTAGKPRAAYSEEGDDGLYYRFADDDEAPCGVTVDGYALVWRGHERDVAERIASFLGASVAEVEGAIHRAISESVRSA
jgi:hypothetical protein